jgi:hypothetical protein
MGLRLNLQTVNWLSYILQPGVSIPEFQEQPEQIEAVKYFLGHVRDNFLSSLEREQQVRVLTNFEQTLETRPALLPAVLSALQNVFGGRFWTALLVPAIGSAVRDYVCSRELLRKLVDLMAGAAPGLILQIEEPSRDIFAVTDVFPAFQAALQDITSWPGMLVWSRSGDSSFFPFTSDSRTDVDSCALWLTKRLGQGPGVDLERIIADYENEFPGVRSDSSSKLHLST